MRAGRLAVFDEHFAVHDRRAVAVGALHVTARARGKVVHELRQAQREPVEVEHVHVGERTRTQDAAIGDAEQRRRCRSSSGGSRLRS